MTDNATVLPPSAPEFAGWRHIYSGKVRDLYEPAEGPNDFLLVVASNRISAFDHVLEPEILGKGALLTRLSRWWFARLDVANHLADDDPAAPPMPTEVADRAMITRRLEMYPIECVVRAALTGSGYEEYLEKGSVSGVELAPGLMNGDMLPEPIYTPAFKAPQGEHDENISFERSVELVGEQAATALRDASLAIFAAASELASAQGIILADTKFEFGADPVTGELVLADEVLTSDSSRYWDTDNYYTAISERDRLASFDKQLVRNWLLGNWDRTGVPPELPSEIVEHTLGRYRELFTRLTGEAPIS